MPVVVGMGSDGPDMEFIDIDEKDIKKLKLGQYIEVTICGYVSKLSVPPGDYGSPNVGLKVSTRDVRIMGTSQAEGFKQLADDSDVVDDPVVEG